ncbi:MAG: hypothetical protein ABSE82_11010 [Nitrososphaerales archaeon]
MNRRLVSDHLAHIFGPKIILTSFGKAAESSKKGRGFRRVFYVIIIILMSESFTGLLGFVMVLYISGFLFYLTSEAIVFFLTVSLAYDHNVIVTRRGLINLADYRQL